MALPGGANDARELPLACQHVLVQAQILPVHTQVTISHLCLLFLPRDVYTVARCLSVYLSVCLSVTRQLCVEMAKHWVVTSF